MRHKKDIVVIPSEKALLSSNIADECIQRMETQYDLLQYEFDGWCVWPILRVATAMMNTNLPLAQRDQLDRLTQLQLAVRDFVALCNKMKRTRYVILTYLSGLVEQEGRLYKDIWFDDLLREMDGFFKIERINNPTFIPRRRQAFLKSHMTTAIFDLSSVLLRRMRKLNKVSLVAEQLSVILRKEFGACSFTPELVKKRIENFVWSKRLYGWLLRRLNPDYLLIADPGQYAIVAAAKEQGIRVIELQHGLVYSHHPSYSWTEYAKRYKSRMPIPDFLFLYGDYWKQVLQANGFWDTELRVVGNLRVDQYRKLRPEKSADNTCNLLLTTQGTDTEKVIQLVAEFLNKTLGLLKIHLYIKLHPAYETSKASYLAAFQSDPRVEILSGTEGPSTFELLTKAHLHLSISSTCHYESLALGVPTIILPFSEHELVTHLCDTRHAFLAHNASQLLNVALKWKEYRVAEDAGAPYFKPGALESMKRALNSK